MVQYSLKGQAALLTGASSGIGKAIALTLGEVGTDEMANYGSNVDSTDAVAKQIRAARNRAIIVKADVSQESIYQTLQ